MHRPRRDVTVTLPATRRALRREHQQAVHRALECVEEKARALMRKNLHLHEFTMAMGTWFFSKGSGEICHDVPYCARGLAVFIEEFDDALYLTGHPMRFTKDGPVVRDW